MITFDDYIARTREIELRKDGYVQYASVIIQHRYPGCTCGGNNIDCRFVSKTWKKKDQRQKNG